METSPNGGPFPGKRDAGAALLRVPRANCATTSRHCGERRARGLSLRTPPTGPPPAMLTRSGIDGFVVPDVKPTTNPK